MRKRLTALVLVLSIICSVLLPTQEVFAGFFIAVIMSHPPAVSHLPTGDFQFSSTGPLECKIDSGTFSPCDTPYTTPVLTNGEHTLTLHAIDADNPEGTQTYTWTVDAPLATITSPTTTTSVSEGPLTVTGTTSSNTRIQISVDGTVSGTVDVGGSGTWQYVIPHVSAGSHNVSAQLLAQFQYAYLTNRSFGTIDVVDVKHKTYVHEISGPDQYYASNFNPHTNKMYAASVWDNKCAVKTFNPTTFAIEQSVSMSPDGSSPINMALDASGNKLYLLCNNGSDDYEVIVLDTNTNTPVANFSLQNDNGEYPSGIAVNPNNSQIWVRTNVGLRVYSVTNHSLSTVININPGNNPSNNIVFNQDGSKAYTGESDVQDLYIVNTSNFTVTSIGTDMYITNLAFTPDFSKLYAISSPNSSIEVLDPGDGMVLDSFSTQQPPESLAITDDGLNFVIGDDHGSGQIYFGTASGGAAVTDTVTAPNGGSYYTSTGNFIAPTHYAVLGDATTVAINVKPLYGVPNTGLGGSMQYKDNAVKAYFLEAASLLSIVPFALITRKKHNAKKNN